MIVYHCAKTKRAWKGILESGVLKANGRNVNGTIEEEYAHVSLVPFEEGAWAVDVIGVDSNQAWLFTLEISDEIPLEPDPSDADYHGGAWKICGEDIPILRVINVEYIRDVKRWELDGSEKRRKEEKKQKAKKGR